MEAVVKEAQDNLGMYGKKTILLLTRYIALIKDNRAIFFLLWKMEQSS